jgi:hypothetical protein
MPARGLGQLAEALGRGGLGRGAAEGVGERAHGRAPEGRDGLVVAAVVEGARRRPQHTAVLRAVCAFDQLDEAIARQLGHEAQP